MRNLILIGVLFSTLALADSLDVGLVGLSAHGGMNKYGWSSAKRKLSETGYVVWNPEVNLTYEHSGWLFNAAYINDCNGYDSVFTGAGYRWSITENFSASFVLGLFYHRELLYNYATSEVTSKKYVVSLAPMVSLQRDFMFNDTYGAFVNVSSNFFLTHAFAGLKARF